MSDRPARGAVAPSRLPWRCSGLAGWLLGHRYLSRSGYHEHEHCLRCGMPQGGCVASGDPLQDAYEAGWSDACADWLHQTSDPTWPIGRRKRVQHPHPTEWSEREPMADIFHGFGEQSRGPVGR